MTVVAPKLTPSNGVSDVTTIVRESPIPNIQENQLEEEAVIFVIFLLFKTAFFY